MRLNNSQRKEKNKLLINIKSRVNTGWPTGALKLLNQKYVKNILEVSNEPGFNGPSIGIISNNDEEYLKTNLKTILILIISIVIIVLFLLRIFFPPTILFVRPFTIDLRIEGTPGKQ